MSKHLGLATALSALLLVAPAHASWSRTGSLAENVRTFQAAVNARGHVVAAWTGGVHGNSALYVAAGNVGRGFGRVRRVATATTYQWVKPRVAVAPDGTGLVAWDSPAPGQSGYDTSIGRTVAVSPNGEPRGIQLLGSQPVVALDGRGRVTALWVARPAQRAYPDLYASEARAPGAPWSAPSLISAGFNLHSQLRLVVNAAGDALGLWTVWNGSGSNVELTTRRAGSAFSAPRRGCPASARRCEGILVDTTPRGEVTASWSEGRRAERRVVHGFLTGEPELGRIPAPRPYGLRTRLDSLDVAADGSAAAAWGAPSGVVVARRLGRKWRRGVRIGRARESSPAVAALGGASTLVVWDERRADEHSFVARRLSREGRRGRRHVLSRVSDLYRGGVPRPSSTFVPAVVAADDRGRAIALWKRYDGRLESARYRP